MATDEDAFACEGAVQLAPAGGALLGLEFGLVRLVVPIGDEGAVGRAGDGVLEDGGLWGEEAGHEVDVVARGGDDDAAVAEVDLVEFGAVDGDVVQGRLVGVDEDVIARFQDFNGGMVDGVGDGLGQLGRLRRA